MNAKQIKTKTDSKRDLNLSRIPLEKAEKPSLWSRLRTALTSSQDMNLESWQRLETKRGPSSFNSNQWRNF
jgi:hypothetical protein